MKSFVLAAALAVLAVARPIPAAADATEVRIVKQYGLPYLPVMVMESEKLVEDEAKKAGLGDVQLRMVTAGNAAAAADVLLSGACDIISAGVPTLASLWAKTKGTANEVKGMSALQSQPFYLLTRDANVKTIADFSATDRIALPGVKISAQALVLEMAAAQLFGEAHFDKLDPLTVQMAHPDATVALLSGKGEVTAHFGVAPYYWKEMADPNIHNVLYSYDVLGGPHTNGVWITSRRFHDQNPVLYRAVLTAQARANALIKENPGKAAEIYLRLANDHADTLAEMTKMVADPAFDYTQVPLKTERFAAFMAQVGRLSAKPASWKDLFFDEIHDKPGS